MRELQIQKIASCIRLAERLKEQLRENEDSFANGTSRNISESYRQCSEAAAERCDGLIRRLQGLQETEQAKLLAELLG